MHRKIAVAPIIMFCFLVNPLWIMSGCEDTLSEEEEKDYTQEDMIQVLRAVPLTYSHVTDAGETIQLTLKIEEIDNQTIAANWTQKIDHTSHQNIISYASACLITTQERIAFKGTLSITSSLEGQDPTSIVQDVALDHANFTVLGTTLDNFQIHVTANTKENDIQKTYSAWISSRDGLAQNAKLASIHY